MFPVAALILAITQRIFREKAAVIKCNSGVDFGRYIDQNIICCKRLVPS